MSVEDTQSFFRAHGYTPQTFPAPEPGSAAFAAYFDHTLLKLDATEAQVDTLCQEAREYGFKVCLHFCRVGLNW